MNDDDLAELFERKLRYEPTVVHRRIRQLSAAYRQQAQQEAAVEVPTHQEKSQT